MNNANNRQNDRIRLLQFISHKSSFNPTTLIYAKNIIDGTESLSTEEIDGHIFYLYQKGYLEIAPLKSSQSPDSFAWAKITSKGIDLIEKIEQNRDTTEYENDFNQEVILMFKPTINQINAGDISNSQFQQNSINSNQNLNIVNNDINSLQTILDTIKSQEPANSNIIQPIEEELKKSTVDWSKINNYLQTLISISALAAQLFIPEIRLKFGLK